jgi:hypothetical protein
VKLAVLTVMLFSVSASALDYTEKREPCASRNPLMSPFFGDLHVHTRYSLDASTQATRTTPEQAYAFATGKKIPIQPWTEKGQGVRSLQLRRPLDFAMVSDHAELIGEVYMCNTPEVEGYSSWQCLLYRHWSRGAYYLFNYMATMEASHLGMCGKDGELCRQAALAPWREMQEAAEKYYDRSSECSFTTFVGYEWTGMQSDAGGNLHRNVVFRNAEVPRLPFSFIDGPSAQQLWDGLDAQCNAAQKNCESLVIPHNSNLSAGYMFEEQGPGDAAMTADYAQRRQRFEPIVEIVQHKGVSECFFESGTTEDELCAFEQQPDDNIAGLPRSPRPDTGFVREVLNKGMRIEQRIGVNPYKFGFIGSTDTHLGAPGAVEEDRFLGHGGAGVPAGERIPPGLPDKLQYNPGGLAVLWARENSRDALFAAMQRREAYATSGPRITSRFFGGWDYPANLCEYRDQVEKAYAGGVPMGGELGPAPAPGHKPSFLVSAVRDSGTPDSPGMPLQRVQVIKSWVTASGERRERIFEVAGNPHNGAWVDTATCRPQGRGFDELCAVWTDESFEPTQRAYYYSRVVENPSCRWSQRICLANKVNCDLPQSIGEGLEDCCSAQHRPSVQERAWSSPIWYTPDD